MKRQRVRYPIGSMAVSALWVLLLAVSGCGGDDGATAENSAGPPRLTKEQLVDRLGEICQEHTELQVDERERFGKKNGIPSPEDATLAEYEREIVEVILPIVRDTIHDVEQLRPPRSEEAKLEAFVSALKGAVATTQKHPNELAEEAGEEPFHMARETAADLEAYFCGQA
jgi:hypothetical protein